MSLITGSSIDAKNLNGLKSNSIVANPNTVSSTKQETGKENPATILNLSLAATLAIGNQLPSIKDFAAVAKDARVVLNGAFEATGGKATMYTTAAEWESAVSSLDRRSLFAIASNEGGQFSKEEIAAARSTMAQQQSDAMGLNNPLADSTASTFKSAVMFLDSVSAEEKASFQWAQERAAAQHSFELISKRDSQEPENLDSDDPVVNMLKSSMEALVRTNDPTLKLEDTPQYKQAQQLSESRALDIRNLVNIKA